MQRLVTVALSFVVLSVPSSSANEWGYDEEVVQPQRAVAQPIKGSKGAPGVKPSTVKSVVAPKPVAKPAGKPSSVVASKVVTAAPPTVPKTTPAIKTGGAKADLTAECWSQIYSVAAKRKLTEAEIRRLQHILKLRPSTSNDRVLVFWPKVTEYLATHPTQHENYAELMRSLLRWRARALDGATTGPAATEEIALINEVLGPPRVAVAGSPAFTEEAVEAYADMACFLYEQSNPGKTIDAFDNRAMFASVVCEKFRNAPSAKDKDAMAAFDLSWSKFKCAWESASEPTRKAMLAALQKTGANAAGATAGDTLLKAILDNWKL